MRPSLFLVGILALSATGLAASTARADESRILAENEAQVADTDEDVPGEVAVDAKDDLSRDELSAIQREYDLHPNSAWSDAHDKIEVAWVPVTEEPALLERLSRDPRIVHG